MSRSGPTENRSNVCCDRCYSGDERTRRDGTESNVIGPDRSLVRTAWEPSRPRIFCGVPSDEAPREIGVGLVGSGDYLEDLGADTRRRHVKDRSGPTDCHLPPLAAGHPLDAREREQKARTQ